MNWFVYKYRSKIYLVERDTLRRREVSEAYVARLSMLNPDAVWGMEQLNSVLDCCMVDSRMQGVLEWGSVTVSAYGVSVLRISIVDDVFEVVFSHSGELTLNGQILCTIPGTSWSVLKLLFCYVDDSGNFKFQLRLMTDQCHVNFNVVYNANKGLRCNILGKPRIVRGA